MGEFSADWLALREPADARARATTLVDALIARLGETAASAESPQPRRILDLGTGTGSNVRVLAPRLPMPQRWCLIDRDVDLLADLAKRLAAWALDRGAIASGRGATFALRGPGHDILCETAALDLARLPGTAASPSRFEALFEDAALVTASALLDLVSARWLEALVGLCTRSRTPVLFVLTYDGRVSCSPGDPDDEWIRTLVNRHQRTAKAFGKALGPDATDVAARLFAAAGYQVARASSDWRLTSDERALQRALLDGWAVAASEMSSASSPMFAGSEDRVRAWHQRRIAHLDAGVSHITVGHEDLAAWPDRQTMRCSVG